MLVLSFLRVYLPTVRFLPALDYNIILLYRLDLFPSLSFFLVLCFFSLFFIFYFLSLFVFSVFRSFSLCISLSLELLLSLSLSSTLFPYCPCLSPHNLLILPSPIYFLLPTECSSLSSSYLLSSFLCSSLLSSSFLISYLSIYLFSSTSSASTWSFAHPQNLTFSLSIVYAFCVLQPLYSFGYVSTAHPCLPSSKFPLRLPCNLICVNACIYPSIFS